MMIAHCISFLFTFTYLISVGFCFGQDVSIKLMNVIIEFLQHYCQRRCKINEEMHVYIESGNLLAKSLSSSLIPAKESACDDCSEVFWIAMVPLVDSMLLLASSTTSLVQIEIKLCKVMLQIIVYTLTMNDEDLVQEMKLKLKVYCTKETVWLSLLKIKSTQSMVIALLSVLQYADILGNSYDEMNLNSTNCSMNHFIKDLKKKQTSLMPSL